MTKRKYGSRAASLPSATSSSPKRRRVEDPQPQPTRRPTPQQKVKVTQQTFLQSWLKKPIESSSPVPSSPIAKLSDTPPSSPPPADPQLSPESPEFLHTRKPTFSFLRRPRSAPAPLSQSPSTGNKPAAPKQPDKDLKQLAIDLGGPTTITCTECSMSYTPSQPGDAALHTRHHAAQLGVIDMSPGLYAEVINEAVWRDKAADECVIRVGRRDKQALRAFAERVLAVASQDLGAVVIEQARLWGEIQLSKGFKEDRYRFFLFLRKRRCVGMVLAERITQGFMVEDDETVLENGEDNRSQRPRTLKIGQEACPATLGISRIWTSTSARRQGISVKLLNATRSHFQPMITTSRSKMAFSQPTELGTAVARKWFGKKSDWLVYSD
ncbi:hypothetical protein BT63DRAFT_327709 [Microthyrium microscopicum]|uniref:Sister chromatid cohesion acetyltransferase Eco1 n=1 Tax=Microthyrium microscopicum TaxID=703497 RepID=A0A6A6U5Y1_9PEZI|nr:hypothetical protein BT63DRAFT_327709 [Microthyrium microscopicum]